MKMVHWILLGMLLTLLAACSKTEQASGRITDKSVLAKGKQIFQANCATCHGKQAEGAPNWRQRLPNGKLPAPPLNGSGHMWHHPMNALRYTIKNGTIKLGGMMPAWKDKLSDEDITAVIAWLQSLWSDEIYNHWKEIDQRN